MSINTWKEGAERMEHSNPNHSVILWQKSTMDEPMRKLWSPSKEFLFKLSSLPYLLDLHLKGGTSVSKVLKSLTMTTVCSRDLMTKSEVKSVWMCSFLDYKASGGGCLVAVLGLGKEKGSYLLHLQLCLNTTGNCLKQGYGWVISDISRAHALQRAESLLAKLWETALSSVNEQKPKTLLKFLFLS